MGWANATVVASRSATSRASIVPRPRQLGRDLESPCPSLKVLVVMLGSIIFILLFHAFSVRLLLIAGNACQQHSRWGSSEAPSQADAASVACDTLARDQFSKATPASSTAWRWSQPVPPSPLASEPGVGSDPGRARPSPAAAVKRRRSAPRSPSLTRVFISMSAISPLLHIFGLTCFPPARQPLCSHVWLAASSAAVTSVGHCIPALCTRCVQAD